MRKLLPILLLFLLCLPTTALAMAEQKDMALCDMTPYKLFEKMEGEQIYLKNEKGTIRFFDIRKSASSGEFVSFKVGNVTADCSVMISSSNLPSGLTRIVTIHTNQNNKAAEDALQRVAALLFVAMGLKVSDVQNLYYQALPSPYKSIHICSIWKNNRRIIAYFKIKNNDDISASFYAVDSPRYIN